MRINHLLFELKKTLKEINNKVKAKEKREVPNVTVLSSIVADSNSNYLSNPIRIMTR